MEKMTEKNTSMWGKLSNEITSTDEVFGDRRSSDDRTALHAIYDSKFTEELVLYSEDLSKLRSELSNVDLSQMRKIGLVRCKNVQRFVDRLKGGIFDKIDLSFTDVESIPEMRMVDTLNIEGCNRLILNKICFDGVIHLKMRRTSLTEIPFSETRETIDASSSMIENLSGLRGVKSADLRCTCITREDVSEYLPWVLQVDIGGTKIFDHTM
jgi:hypothetical protein